MREACERLAVYSGVSGLLSRNRLALRRGVQEPFATAYSCLEDFRCGCYFVEAEQARNPARRAADEIKAVVALHQPGHGLD